MQKDLERKLPLFLLSPHYSLEELEKVSLE